MDICLESSTNKVSDCIRIADEVARYHGVLNLLWHPPIFNTLEYADARDIYIKINQHCNEHGAWITRACDIYKWLTLRNRNLVACEFNPSDKTLKIIPAPGVREQYLTIYPPNHSVCDTLSDNAQILQNDGDCIFIKIHSLQKNNEIIVRIS